MFDELHIKKKINVNGVLQDKQNFIRQTDEHQHAQFTVLMPHDTTCALYSQVIS